VALAGCSSGSLVAVTVDANPALSDVARLHVVMAASGMTQSTDVALTAKSIPPTHSFGIQLPHDVSGMLDVTLNAIDSTGRTVATVQGSTTINVGGRADLMLTFGMAPGDLGMPADLAGVDLLRLPLTWSKQKLMIGGSSCTNAQHAVWGGDATHVWSSGYDSIATFMSTGNDVWTQVSTNPFYNVNGLWGLSPTIGYMVDDTGDVRTLNSTATAWGNGASISGLPNLTAVWGTANNNVYITSNGGNGATGGNIYHNGTGTNLAANWIPPRQTSTTGLNGIHGAAADDFYAVGDTGTVYRCDLSMCTFLPAGGSTNLRGVFAADAMHVYVVGDTGTILFSTGNNAFTAQTVPAPYTSTNFHAVWASAPDDVYVVGDAGVILHSIGNGVWQHETSGLESTTENLFSIWGSGPNDVYAVSSGCSVLHGR
jgi:hypothetical protein